MGKRSYRTLLAAVVLSSPGVADVPAQASDHDDTPLLKQLGRHDAQVTDLYVFRRGERLVLIVCTDPAVPPSLTDYQYPPDLRLRIFLDNRSRVSYDDPVANARFGGTVLHPDRIRPDVTFEVTFDQNGGPVLQVEGLPPGQRKQVRFFAGLRDDPFIRTPRAGRNVAAIVIEVPLDAVLRDGPTVLVWANSLVPDVQAPMADHGGRSLRSQFLPNMAMNTMSPAQQATIMGVVPDVVIYSVLRDLLFDATFPNGRELTDDVVALVSDIPLPGGVLPGEPPDRATTNDVPFLDTFPYLAPPHPPAP